MNRLENVLPRLKPGLFREAAGRFIYETRSGETLQVESGAVEFLKLSRGAYSVREIVEHLYSSNKNFSFTAIYQGLLDFADQNIFENSDEILNPRSKSRSRPAESINADRLPLYLRKISLFASLSQETIEHIAGISKLESYKAGQVIIKRNTQGDDAFALLNGEAGVYSDFQSLEDDEALAILPPLSVFGESAAVLRKPRTADVVAMSDCTVVRFDVHRVLEPEGSKHLSKSLKIRLVLSQVLKLHPFFKRLPHDVIHLLLKCCRVEKLAASKMIIEQGGEGRDFYFIVSGQAVVIKDRLPEAKLMAGSHFGEVAALTGKERNATVMTDTPCMVLVMDGRNFISFLASYFSLALEVEQIAEQRDQTNEEPTQEIPFLDELTVTEEVTQTLDAIGDWDLWNPEGENDEV